MANPLDWAINNIKKKASELFAPVAQSFNDNRGFVQQGHLTAQPLQQAFRQPIQQVQNVGQNYLNQVHANQQTPFFNNTGNNPIQWLGKVGQDIKQRGAFEGLQDLTYPLLTNPYVEPLTEPITGAVREANFKAGRPSPVLNALLGQTDSQMAGYKGKSPNTNRIGDLTNIEKKRLQDYLDKKVLPKIYDPNSQSKFNSMHITDIPILGNTVGLLKNAGQSYLKTTPAGGVSRLMDQQVKYADQNHIPIPEFARKTNDLYKKIGLDKQFGAEDVGNIAGGIGSADVVGNTIGGVINFGLNRTPFGSHGKVSDKDAFNQGYEMSAKLSFLGKLAETPLKPLLEKINNPATKKAINTFINNGEYGKAAAQFIKNAGESAVRDAVGFGAYGGVLPAKDLHERVAHIIENAKTGALFGGGISGTKDALGVAGVQGLRGIKAYNKLPREIREGGYIKVGKDKTPPLSPIEGVGGVSRLKVGQGSGVGERSATAVEPKVKIVNGKVKIKMRPVTAPQIEQPSLLSEAPTGGSQQPPSGIPPSSKGFSSNTRVPQKPRGFTTSVQESPTVLSGVKKNVEGGYIPKPNRKLMGEAEALLHEGASIDIKNVKNADQKVAATIQAAISEQRRNPQLAANLFNNLSEQGTELGRGVQAFSLLDKMSPEAISLSAAGKIKKYNLTATRKIPELTGEQVSLIADKVAALDKLKVGSREHNIAVNELSNLVNEFIPSSIVDKAITVWKAGLLTSLRTHERNLLGNTIMGAAEVGKDAFASPIDRLMAMRTGRRTLTFNTQGQAGGMREGLTAAKDIVQRGYDPEQTIAKFDQKRITWGNNPLEQALKKGTDAVFRTLGGEDKPFLHGATARSLYEQAKTSALNVGRSGDRAFIEKLVANPTEEMIKIAETDANYATFHDKNMISGIANGIKRAASNPKYGKWGEFGKAITEILAPFTGVPSSIVGKTIDYSPIGLAKGTVNVGRVLAGHVPEMQRQAAQEMGRGIVGTGLFGLGAYLMSKGLMTGQPKDTKEANLWAAQGKQANSVLIGGKWRSINSIGPQNLVMLAGAKYQEEMGKEDGSIGAYAGGLAKDQLSQTFLAGVQGPLNAITDPARYGQSYLGNQAASTVPNIVKDTSKAFDSSQRESNNIGDYFRNSIPGLRNQGIEKRDVLGNVMKQEPTGVAAFVDLFNSKTPIENPLVNELDRLNKSGNEATPSKLQKSQTILKQKVTLTPTELNNFESGAGQVVQKQLNDLIQTAEYKNLTDEEKADAIDKVVTNARKLYKSSNDIQSETPSVKASTTSTFEGNKITYVDNGSLKTIDLSPPTTGQGIDAFTNQNWNLTKARDVYKANLSDSQKKEAYKKLGVDPADVEYDYKATHNNDIKTQYILSKAESMSHDKLLKELFSGRVVSSSGTQFASNGVVDNLYNQGVISKSEQVALKRVKVNKSGKSLIALKGGRKPKKLKVPKLKTFKAKETKIKIKTIKNPKFKSLMDKNKKLKDKS